jgi:plasmid stability protein
MNQLVIEDLDPTIVERLKVRAQQQGRTLEAELKAILEAAALEVTIPSNDEEDREQVQTVKTTPEELGWSPGFFEEVIGGWQGEPLTRGEQGKYEQRLWELL